MSFTVTSAERVTDLLSDTSTYTVRWNATDPDEGRVIEDVLGKRMVVTRVSLVVDGEGPRIYLGGFPVSRVNSKVLSSDHFIPVTVDVEDSLATLIEMDLPLDRARLQGIGHIGRGYFNGLMSDRASA